MSHKELVLWIKLPFSGINICVANKEKVLAMLRGNDDNKNHAKILSTCIIRNLIPDWHYGDVKTVNNIRQFLRRMDNVVVDCDPMEDLARELLDTSFHYRLHSESCFYEMVDLISDNAYLQEKGLKKELLYFNKLLAVWVSVTYCDQKVATVKKRFYALKAFLDNVHLIKVKGEK